MTDLIPAPQSSPSIKAGTHHLAFPVYTEVPLGCALYRLPNERMAPHALRDDTVVIDCTDRAVEFGEYFLILQRRGPCVWQFLKPPALWGADRPSVYLRIRSCDCDQLVGIGRGYFSDGAMYQDALEKIVMGWVIGIFDRQN